jgi:hypothetical protein
VNTGAGGQVVGRLPDERLPGAWEFGIGRRRERAVRGEAGYGRGSAHGGHVEDGRTSFSIKWTHGGRVEMVEPEHTRARRGFYAEVDDIHGPPTPVLRAILDFCNAVLPAKLECEVRTLGRDDEAWWRVSAWRLWSLEEV